MPSFSAAPITGQLTVTDEIDGLTNNDPFAVTADGTNGTATIEADGSWSYTPNADFNGTDTFTVTITDDDGNTETQDITVTVNAVDDPTVVTGGSSGTGDEDGGAITGQIAASDVDGITNNSPYEITTNRASGSATIDSDGNWVYEPYLHQYGTDTFTVTITDDDGNTQNQDITITVNAVDDATVITAGTSGSGDEDGGNYRANYCFRCRRAY